MKSKLPAIALAVAAALSTGAKAEAPDQVEGYVTVHSIRGVCSDRTDAAAWGACKSFLMGTMQTLALYSAAGMFSAEYTICLPAQPTESWGQLSDAFLDRIGNMDQSAIAVAAVHGFLLSYYHKNCGTKS